MRKQQSKLKPSVPSKSTKERPPGRSKPFQTVRHPTENQRLAHPSGKVKLKGQNWNINQALAGEWVQIVPTGERWMVFYCTTLVREIDPAIQRSTIVERWIASR